MNCHLSRRSHFIPKIFRMISETGFIVDSAGGKSPPQRRTAMISVEHLTKCYGSFLAVDDLSFEIGEGHVYGFLGPNGAGKSTTMNIMTGCLSATSGRVFIDGHDIFEEPEQAKKLIGYLPEQPPLYMSETPAEYLRFVGEAKGLRGGALKHQIDAVIEQTKLWNMRDRRISTLSKGYKQRVGIAQALLGDPKVIILDEPTVGLDPIQIIEIRDLIRELGRAHTVIFSSHILSEVQTICDQILMVNKGKLVAFGAPEELERQLLTPNELLLTAEINREELCELLEEVELISTIETEKADNGRITAHVRTDHSDIYEVSRAVFFTFAGKGIPLLEMALRKASLEDVFLELADDDTGPETEETLAAEHTEESEADRHDSGIEA